MTTSDEQLDRLQEHYRRLAGQLAEVGYIHKGSLTERLVRCGTASCGCHKDPPKLHGPYWQWSTKVRGKTVSRIVTADQAAVYREFIENRKLVEKILAQMYEISQEAFELQTSADELQPRSRP